jgi:hypothetical protein
VCVRGRGGRAAFGRLVGIHRLGRRRRFPHSPSIILTVCIGGSIVGQYIVRGLDKCQIPSPSVAPPAICNTRNAPGVRWPGAVPRDVRRRPWQPSAGKFKTGKERRCRGERRRSYIHRRRLELPKWRATIAPSPTVPMAATPAGSQQHSNRPPVSISTHDIIQKQAQRATNPSFSPTQSRPPWGSCPGSRARSATATPPSAASRTSRSRPRAGV